MDPAVLAARALPPNPSTPHQLQIDRYDHCIAIETGAEHLLLRTQRTSLRLDIVAGTVLAGPVVVEPSISLDRLDRQIAMIRILDSLLRGKTPHDMTDSRLPRLVLALRAFDGRCEGASLRDLARGIFGTTEWPGDGDHVKSRARRLVKLSESLWHAGPGGVLAHRI
jgi:hypothetical protein